MSTFVTHWIEQVRQSARAVGDFSQGLFEPTLRLGITGLSRAGKTVFITALVHGLVRGGRFPVFDAMSGGRIAGARLAPQPDDAVPRFDYEAHLKSLIEQRLWPDSTRQIGELRLVIDYQSRNGAMRTLTLDIVDYPGEWLLDLPLLEKSYEQWSAETLAQARLGARAALSGDWLNHLATLDPSAPAKEEQAIESARLFTAYLQSCRDERYSMSLLPPGRFLLPGDMAGSPALTFAPLDVPDAAAPRGSLWAMMRRRYDAYRENVVRPFFRDHFSRLDRQIVLVDALAAFNAGPEAVQDLQNAMASILSCFRVGRGNLISALFRPRIDRLVFAATKADHLHHTGHDRLEAILRQLVSRAIDRADFEGAEIDVVALAAVRATREASVAGDDGEWPVIVGTPAPGETANGRVFDGEAEVAVFPGDLPADPAALFHPNAAPFRGLTKAGPDGADFRFVRFRPPGLERREDGPPSLPHIRLDRALQFLIGDRLT